MTVAKGGIVYRSVAPSAGITEEVVRLYRKVYGDQERFAKRMEWELLGHPRRAEIALHCAEQEGELVGVTVRHPADLMCQGSLIKAYFASNTMVAPEARGLGIVRELYRMASEGGSLQLSKGTAPGMFAILKKMGYLEIRPDTFQIAYLRPFRLALRRLGIVDSSELRTFIGASDDTMAKVAEIPDDISCMAPSDGMLKDAPYLRWRYLQVPHRRYLIFVRRESGRPLSLLVLRTEGKTVHLVDLMWDVRQQDEPGTALAFARKASLRVGAYRFMAWSTDARVRACLARNGFRDTEESPHFSYFSAGRNLDLDWQQMRFVHGDGDLDYL